MLRVGPAAPHFAGQSPRLSLLRIRAHSYAYVIENYWKLKDESGPADIK